MIFYDIQRETLSDQVARILKRYVREENLQAGDRLPSEAHLAATLGVSRGILREALQSLASEGIIVKQHGRGNFVNDFDRDALLDDSSASPQNFGSPAQLYATRVALEVGAVTLIVREATDEELRECAKIVDAMERNFRAGKSTAADDLAFHLSLLNATHNSTLQSLGYIIEESRRLVIYGSPKSLTGSKDQDQERVMKEHREVLEALCDRDGERAILATYRGLKHYLNGEADTAPRDRPPDV